MTGAQQSRRRANSFFSWSVTKRFLFLRRQKKPFQDWRCLSSGKDLFATKLFPCPYLENCYNFPRRKKCCHVSNIPFKDQKPTITFFGFDGTYCFVKEDEFWLRKWKTICFLNDFLAPVTISLPDIGPKKGKLYFIFGTNVSTPHWFINLIKDRFLVLF